MTDKDIRDLMLNGEERVPSRVWSNIRSRIGCAPTNGAWIWGFALAAIAVVAVVLPVALRKQPVLPAETTAKVIVVDGSAESAELQIPEGRFAQALPQAAEKSISGRKPGAASAMLAATESMESAVKDDSDNSLYVDDKAILTAESAEPETPAEDASSVPQAKKSEPASESRGNESLSTLKSIGSVDAFAQMSMEDERKASRNLAITAGSSVSGNDSDFLGESSSIFRSSSSGIRTNSGITETSSSVYGIPVTFSLGIRHSFNEKVSIGSGLTYSLLTRTFTGNYNDIIGADIRHNIQYLGIPVNVYYSIISNKVIDFHVFGGGSAEFCVSNSYRIGQPSGDILLREGVRGIQASAAVGLGASFRLNNFLSICVDPSARYYFRSSHPKSLRTDKPFMVNLELGLKFDL